MGLAMDIPVDMMSALLDELERIEEDGREEILRKTLAISEQLSRWAMIQMKAIATTEKDAEKRQAMYKEKGLLSEGIPVLPGFFRCRAQQKRINRQDCLEYSSSSSNHLDGGCRDCPRYSSTRKQILGPKHDHSRQDA